MTTALTRTQGAQPTRRSTPSPGGGTVARATLGWYGDASGGFFLKALDEWNPRLAFLVFPRITSSSRIDRHEIGRFMPRARPVSTLPIARQVRELRRRCRSTSPSSAESWVSPAPPCTIGSMTASPTPTTGPGFGP